MTNEFKQHTVESIKSVIGNKQEREQTLKELFETLVLASEVGNQVTMLHRAADKWHADSNIGLTALEGFAGSEEADLFYQCVKASLDEMNDAIDILLAAAARGHLAVKDMREDASHQQDEVNKEAVR